MNVIEVANLSLSYNWSGLFNAVLTFSLIILTYFQVREGIRQTRLLKLHRIDDEFKMVVEPLRSNIGSNYYFRDRPPGNRNNQLNERYFTFWENIDYNKYLCPRYLRDQIETFNRKRPTSIHGFDEDPEKESVIRNFDSVKKDLFEAVSQRYSELHKEKEELMKKL